MRYKKVGIFFGAVAIALVLAACKPSFSSGSTLTTSALGPLVKVSWPTATVDSDKTVKNYRIDVNGVEIRTGQPHVEQLRHHGPLALDQLHAHRHRHGLRLRRPVERPRHRR